MNSKILLSDMHLSIEQLKQDNELKTKWLSLIAHDFKGLFSNINVLLDMLENKSISQEMFMSMLPEIRQITRKNIKTLESTFEWVNSQTKGFSPHIEDVKIHDLYLLLKDEYSESINLKELSVVYAGNQELCLQTDRFLITFILKQIVENAIKYSNNKGVIHVTAVSDANSVTITVKDNGMGMRHDVATKLGTLDGSPYTGTIGEKGAGLSLVVVKEFVEKLNGRMEIYSVMDEGTSIELLFTRKNNKV